MVIVGIFHKYCIATTTHLSTTYSKLHILDRNFIPNIMETS